MDGHVAQPRMSWRHFHVARLANTIERSHLRLCALLVLLSLACFLPGFSSLQPMDRDEPRYAQASKQMLESGDLVDIRFQDEARHKKPVGIYWLQSATVAIGDALGVSDPRTTIALYRIPSLLGGIATVLLTYWAALAFIGRRGAFLAAAFMATSIILMVEARLAKTDAALTACAVATMGALARAYLSRGAGILPRRTLAFFWLGLAAGILIKGPLVPMFVGLAAACLWWRERSGRWLLALRPIHGAVFTLLVVLPWFVAIAIKSGGAFFSASVGHDMLGRWEPPRPITGRRPVIICWRFSPPSGRVPFWRRSRFRSRDPPTRRARDVRARLDRAFLAGVRDRPHQAAALRHAALSGHCDSHRHGDLPAFRGPAQAVRARVDRAHPVHSAGPRLRSSRRHLEFRQHIAVSRAAGARLVGGCGLLCVVAFVRAQVLKSVWASFAAAVLLSIGVFGLGQLDLRSLKLSPRMAEVAHNLACANPRIGTLGYREPSLVFLVGTDLEMLESGVRGVGLPETGRLPASFSSRSDSKRNSGPRTNGWASSPRSRPAFRVSISTAGGKLDIGAYAWL